MFLRVSLASFAFAGSSGALRSQDAAGEVFEFVQEVLISGQAD